MGGPKRIEQGAVSVVIAPVNAPEVNPSQAIERKPTPAQVLHDKISAQMTIEEQVEETRRPLPGG